MGARTFQTLWRESPANARRLHASSHVGLSGGPRRTTGAAPTHVPPGTGPTDRVAPLHRPPPGPMSPLGPGVATGDVPSRRIGILWGHRVAFEDLVNALRDQRVPRIG